MRIAVCHNQPTGGARRALHGFCAELRARHTIDVFTLDSADDHWLRDGDVADHVQRAPVRRRQPVRFGLYANDVRAWLDQRDLDAAYRSMAGRVDAGCYDVALVDVCRYTLVPSVLDHLRTPSVFYAHNGPAWMEGGAWRPPLTAWERARQAWHGPVSRMRDASLATRQRSSVRAATAVATNSRHTAGRLRSAYGVDAVVCPPGVAVPPTRQAPRSSFVLSVGEIEPRKGFGFLIEALSRLPAACRPPLRVLANQANPTELTGLRHLARQAGVALDVQVAPPDGVLAWHYRRAKLFLYGAHHEALGLAPLEAMVHGTPVVAVAEGGVAETVLSGTTGFLTERDPDQFAERVRILLEDDASREHMGRAARAHVERWWAPARRTRALEMLLSAAAGTESRAAP